MQPSLYLMKESRALASSDATRAKSDVGQCETLFVVRVEGC